MLWLLSFSNLQLVVMCSRNIGHNCLPFCSSRKNFHKENGQEYLFKNSRFFKGLFGILEEWWKEPRILLVYCVLQSWPCCLAVISPWAKDDLSFFHHRTWYKSPRCRVVIMKTAYVKYLILYLAQSRGSIYVIFSLPWKKNGTKGQGPWCS